MLSEKIIPITGKMKALYIECQLVGAYHGYIIEILNYISLVYAIYEAYDNKKLVKVCPTYREGM